MLAGLAKLMWSICVIMGAFFFNPYVQVESTTALHIYIGVGQSLTCLAQRLLGARALHSHLHTLSAREP